MLNARSSIYVVYNLRVPKTVDWTYFTNNTPFLDILDSDCVWEQSASFGTVWKTTAVVRFFSCGGISVVQLYGLNLHHHSETIVHMDPQVKEILAFTIYTVVLLGKTRGRW